MEANPHEFLETIAPALASGDANELARRVRARWPMRDLCRFLGSCDTDARRAAAVVLGLVGDKSVIPCLTRSLRDPDRQVNEMAEHGLWSVYFRACGKEAAQPFKEGVALMAVESYDRAIESFRQAKLAAPTFAEAFNQCAIAHFFCSQWEQSLSDCRRAVDLIPTHFGAIAGMGHCYTQMGELCQAFRCYRQALRINPHMPAISRAIHKLEARIHDANDASGEYLFDHTSV